MINSFSLNTINLILFCCIQVLSTFQNVNADQIHHTTRCICKCNGNDKIKASPSRATFVKSPIINKGNCTCHEIVLPKIEFKTDQINLYCLGCECKYETRSIWKIQISIALVIMIFSALILYLLCLIFLKTIFKEPLHINRNRDGAQAAHHEYFNSAAGYESLNVYDSLGDHTGHFTPVPSRTRYFIQEAFEKLMNKQSKWKAQLEIQRSKIYD